MNQQDLKELQKQIMEEKKQAYQAEPELARWVAVRKTLLLIVLGFWLAHELLSVMLMLQMHSGSIGMEIVKCLFQLLWLCAFMSPEAGWRINLILYLSALVNFAMFFQAYRDIPNLWAVIMIYPSFGILACIEALFPFLLLGIAVYLTAFPGHRELSERVEIISKQAAEELKELAQRK